MRQLLRPQIPEARLFEVGRENQYAEVLAGGNGRDFPG